MPVELKWGASDKPGPSEACKGMLLALFNEQSKETMKIDLWTKEMQVVEMTGNKELANQMQQFVFYFGQATGAIPKQGDVK